MAARPRLPPRTAFLPARGAETDRAPTRWIEGEHDFERLAEAAGLRTVALFG